MKGNMENKDIKEMFAEAAEKAVKEDIGEDSILNSRKVADIDHYKLCPFRSLDVDDCPLCKLANL